MPAPREKSRFNVYIKNLSSDVGDDDLLQWFGQFGSIRQARVMINTDDGTSRGYGFVLFESEDAAAASIVEMNGAEKRGFTLHVEAAEHDGEKAATETNVVWVRNIPVAVSEDALEDILVARGVSGLRSVKRSDMPKKPEAWMASMDFRNVDAARRAIDVLHQKVIFDEQSGLQMLAKFGEPSKPTPESGGRRSQRCSPCHTLGRTPGKDHASAADRRAVTAPHSASQQLVFPSAPDVFMFHGYLRRLSDGNYAVVEGQISSTGYQAAPQLGSPANAIAAAAAMQPQPPIAVSQSQLTAHSMGGPLPAGPLSNGLPPAPLFATQPTSVPMMMLAASQNSVGPGQLLMLPQAASLHHPAQSSVDT